MQNYVLVDFLDFNMLNMMIETLWAYIGVSIGEDCIIKNLLTPRLHFEIHDDLCEEKIAYEYGNFPTTMAWNM